ncbi:hypothetical protein ACWATR_00160 [Nostoc sp. UIC 10890]
MTGRLTIIIFYQYSAYILKTIYTFVQVPAIATQEKSTSHFRFCIAEEKKS